MGISAGVFAESKTGDGIRHTALSRILRDEEGMRDIVGVMCEEMGRGAVRTVDALDKWGEAKSPEQSVSPSRCFVFKYEETWA